MGRGRPATSRAGGGRAKSRVAYAIGSLYLSVDDDLPARQAAGPAMSRLTRAFVRAAIAAAIALAAAGAQADALLIGVAAPLTGPSARLGAQVRAGAQAAAAVDPAATLDVVDDQCSAEGGAKAAERSRRGQGRASSSASSAPNRSRRRCRSSRTAGIPVITVGVRTNSLTDRKARPAGRSSGSAPRADAEGGRRRARS